ncbi:VacJ family lipoprotein [Planctomycetota bacterium]
MKPLLYAVIILAVLISGCAATQKNPAPNDPEQISDDINDEDFDLLEEELAEKRIEIDDPIELLNRMMFNFNDICYFCVLKPVTQVYTNIVPKPARTGIDNFFQNLTTPLRFVSCHLQGKIASADTELNRFLINSTVGVLGFGDPARDQHGLEPPPAEDLGQALAIHGFDNGFYIVWPILGPSTLRDSAGLAGGIFLNPVFYVDPTEVAVSISAVKYTNKSTFHTGEYEAFKDAALDPYVAMRQAYIQYRDNQIKE